MTQLNWPDIVGAAGDDGKTRVPDGWYDVEVKSTTVGMTSKGDPKVGARMVVLNGPYEGGSIFKDFIISKDNTTSQKILVEHLGALGITREYLVQHRPTDDQLAELLKGRKANVLLGTREWNGKEYDDVKAFKPSNPGGGYAFGGDTILPTPAPVPVPSGPTIPSMPMPVAAAPAAVPVPPVDGDNGLPPEPPF